MLVRGEQTKLLIDCAGSPTQRLAQVGVGPAEVDYAILTHKHPDHIYGFPMLMLNAWMAGRRAPMHVYGLRETLDCAQGLLDAVGVRGWPNFFPVEYHTLEMNGTETVEPIGEFDMRAIQSVHFVPTIALRITERSTGTSMAYSADTSPNPNIVEIACEADLLLHEATTWRDPSEGHSSASEAGVEAEAARVKELVLLHLPPDVEPGKWRAAAKEAYGGKVTVAKDFDRFTF